MWVNRAKALAAAFALLAFCPNLDAGTEIAGNTTGKGPEILTSPVHPSTFYLRGYPKLQQDLGWDKKTGTLIGRVSYSLYMTHNDELINPANYTTFTLPFPEVRSDAQGNLFIQKRHHTVAIGRLTSGVFGTQVETNDNVQFVAHRQHDQLSGQLIIDHR